MNLNKVFIIGRLTADPQLRTTLSGNRVASFSIATNRIWKDKNGNRKESVEFHNIVLWGRQGEIAAQFLTKGSVACIEGRLQTRSWQDKNGVSRKTTEIIGERIQLGPKSGESGAKFDASPTGREETQTEEIPVIDLDEEITNPGDLPF